MEYEMETKITSMDFRGDGWEYFKIWIVNVLLTIVTLGIYSAWATVRNKQYFCSNFYVGDANFRYMANPIDILIGRIIAVIAFSIYALAVQLAPMIGIGLLVVIMIAVPYFYNEGLAFDRKMTSHQNIQFRFHGTYWEAVKALFLWPMLGALTLGIMMPYALHKSVAYVVEYSAYGKTRFSFKAKAMDFVRIFLVLIGTGITLGGFVWGVALAVPALAFLSPIVIAFFYIFAFLYFQTAMNNVFYNHIDLAGNRFQAEFTMGAMSSVIFTNLFYTIITLGLYLPAAKVRMAKYVASCITIDTSDAKENFEAAEDVKVSAIGEQMGQIFAG